MISLTKRYMQTNTGDAERDLKMRLTVKEKLCDIKEKQTLQFCQKNFLLGPILCAKKASEKLSNALKINQSFVLHLLW